MENTFNLLIANFTETKANEFRKLYADANTIQRIYLVEIIKEYLEQMYSEYNGRYDYSENESYQ